MVHGLSKLQHKYTTVTFLLHSPFAYPWPIKMYRNQIFFIHFFRILKLWNSIVNGECIYGQDMLYRVRQFIEPETEGWLTLEFDQGQRIKDKQNSRWDQLWARVSRTRQVYLYLIIYCLVAPCTHLEPEKNVPFPNNLLTDVTWYGAI